MSVFTSKDLRQMADKANPETRKAMLSAIDHFSRRQRSTEPPPVVGRCAEKVRSLALTLPFACPNPLNRREHWGPRSKRAKQQRTTTNYRLRSQLLPALPVTVTLTRIGVRELDPHDGLPASLKPVVDGIADAYGLASDRDERLTIRYAQGTGKPEVRVRIERRMEETR